MKVLVMGEYSQIVTAAFRKAGHDAFSCDLLPTIGNPDWHYQCDVREIISNDWDLMIAHPDCTYMCSSGLHWNGRTPGRAEKTAEALDFVRFLMAAPIEKIAIENPVGCIGTQIRKADQYIQPYEFGHDASKKTGLWLKNLPKLQGTKYIAPRYINGRPRWGNQTDSGQNKLPPSDTRWMDRARTYEGWAEAMATQWGNHND